MGQLYRHSGTVPLAGVVRTAMMGTAAGTFLAIIYAFAIHYIPFVYLNLLMTLGFGFVIGAVVSREAKATNIRHTYVPALIGLFCGLAGLYVAWGADMIARIGVPPNRGYFAGLDPLMLSGYVSWFFENGLWGIKGGVISGWPLAMIWMIEAGMIVGLAVLIPLGEFQTNVFCEPCQTWAEPENDVVRLQNVHADDVTRRILADDFAVLAEHPRAADGDMTFLRLNLTCCPGCADTNALALDRVVITLDKENKPSEKTESLVARLLVPGDLVESIRSAGKPVESGGAAPVQDADETEAAEQPSASGDR